MYTICPLGDLYVRNSPDPSLASSTLCYKGRALRCCTDPAEPSCALVSGQPWNRLQQFLLESFPDQPVLDKLSPCLAR